MDGSGDDRGGKGSRGLRINGRLVIPEDELEVSYARSGGPGGQNVNKVETKVLLSFSIAESRAFGERRRELLMERLSSRLTKDGRLLMTSSATRERARNEEDVRQRMAEVLAEALRTPKARKKTKPTKGSKRRRLEQKKRRGETKRLRGRVRGDNS